MHDESYGPKEKIHIKTRGPTKQKDKLCQSYSESQKPTPIYYPQRRPQDEQRNRTGTATLELHHWRNAQSFTFNHSQLKLNLYTFIMCRRLSHYRNLSLSIFCEAWKAFYSVKIHLHLFYSFIFLFSLVLCHVLISIKYTPSKTRSNKKDKSKR